MSMVPEDVTPGDGLSLLCAPSLTPAATSLTFCSAFAAATFASAAASFAPCLTCSVVLAASCWICWSDLGAPLLLQPASHASPTVMAAAARPFRQNFLKFAFLRVICVSVRRGRLKRQLRFLLFH